MAKKNVSLDAHITDVIARAVREAVEAFRKNILDDVTRAIGAPAAAPAGRRAAASAPAAGSTRSARSAGSGAKRTWPTCSKAGCSNKFFGPSGDARLCYQHYLEAGGKHPNQVKAKAAAKSSGKAAKAAKPAKGGARKGGAAVAKGGAAAASSGNGLLQQVVDLIAKTPGLRAEQISKQLGAKPEPVKAVLATLRESGKVKISGKARGTTYSL